MMMKTKIKIKICYFAWRHMRSKQPSVQMPNSFPCEKYSKIIIFKQKIKNIVF